MKPDYSFTTRPSVVAGNTELVCVLQTVVGPIYATYHLATELPLQNERAKAFISAKLDDTLVKLRDQLLDWFPLA